MKEREVKASFVQVSNADLTNGKKLATFRVMAMSLQRQAIQIFRDQFGGRNTLSAMLADLGMYLRVYGLKTPLRQMSDLLDLNDAQATAAIKYIPTLYRPLLSQRDIVSACK